MRLSELGLVPQILIGVVLGAITGLAMPELAESLGLLGQLFVGMLKAASYDVYDLGVDVPPEKFVETLKKTGAPVLALSALITTAYESIKMTVEAVEEAGIRGDVRIMIGGGPINQEVVDYSGADDTCQASPAGPSRSVRPAAKPSIVPPRAMMRPMRLMSDLGSR